MVKHYNPIRMWGSYVGALTLLVGYSFFIKCPFINLLNSSCRSWNEVFAVLLGASNFGVNQINSGFGLWYLPYTLITLGIIILGFIIGWGIHSLFRKLRR